MSSVGRTYQRKASEKIGYKDVSIGNNCNFKPKRKQVLSSKVCMVFCIIFITKEPQILDTKSIPHQP